MTAEWRWERLGHDASLADLNGIQKAMFSGLCLNELTVQLLLKA